MGVRFGELSMDGKRNHVGRSVGEYMSLTINTEPTEEPIDLEEAKEHLRIAGTEFDAKIDSLIVAARKNTEHYLKRALITQTWDLYLDEFDDEMAIPKPPLASVSQIDYTDTDGNNQTLSSAIYTVDTDKEPGRIVKAFNQSWPSTRDVINAVQITFVAGYGDAPDVPDDIRNAILLKVEKMFDNPDDRYTAGLNATIESLLHPYKIYRL